MGFYDDNPDANPRYCLHESIQFMDGMKEVVCLDCEMRWKVGQVVDEGLFDGWNRYCEHELVEVIFDEFVATYPSIDRSLAERIKWFCPRCQIFLDKDKERVG